MIYFTDKKCLMNAIRKSLFETKYFSGPPCHELGRQSRSLEVSYNAEKYITAY